MINRNRVPELIHIPKQERLVAGTFNEELQLRMLVGDAQSCRRCLAIIDFVSATVDFLSQTFAPQLLEPKRKFPERLRIREQHQNAFSSFPLQNELNECG